MGSYTRYGLRYKKMLYFVRNSILKENVGTLGKKTKNNKSLKRKLEVHKKNIR